MAAPQRPRPIPDPLSAPFWEAANEGRLAIQHCEACDRYQHPPAALCQECHDSSLGFRDVSGRGSVFSHTTNYQRNVAGFEESVPYVNLVIELDEQSLLLLVSDMPVADADWVEIGAPVEVAFERIDEELALPQFRRRTGGV